MLHEPSLIAALLSYAAAGMLLALSLRRRGGRLRAAAVVLTLAGVLLQSYAQVQQWLGGATADVSLLSLLSLSALVILVLLLASLLSRNSLFDAGLIALPLAVIALGLEWLVPAESLPLGDVSAGTAVHVSSSILALGVLSIAAVYAVFIATCDHFLRSHRLNHLVTALPPLEVLERMMFSLIGVGFALLSVSLLSGLLFVSDLFAQHLVHKTILTLLAWLVFGVLLWGRVRHGWRGRTAVRLTLAGIALLVVGYFGSKFVLENLLGRSWRE